MEEDLKKEIQEMKEMIKELLMEKIIPEEYQYFTSDQVKTIYHINKDSLIKYRKSGEIKYKRLGNGTYIYPKIQFRFNNHKK